MRITRCLYIPLIWVTLSSYTALSFASKTDALDSIYQHYLKTGQAKNIVTDGFVQFAYGVNAQPIISTHPLELTVISLEPGEQVTNVSSGDPMRWSYSLAYSGEGNNKQAHVMVKPSENQIATDLVIMTDRRFYTLKLVATNNGKYIRDVRFWYPESVKAQFLQYQTQQSHTIAQLPSLNLSELNFNYQIKSAFFDKTPSWKPQQVFDDGRHTFIQFREMSQEKPALFIKQGKELQLVNYRVQAPYYIVDRIFDEAMLISGVNRAKQQITIQRVG